MDLHNEIFNIKIEIRSASGKSLYLVYLSREVRGRVRGSVRDYVTVRLHDRTLKKNVLNESR